VDERDLELRNLTYRRFVELGRAPIAEEVGAYTGLTVPEIQAGWRRLHDAHALVLNPGTMEIRMANPFSGVPSAYRVQANKRWWFANCAWDAFGILGALHVGGRIETFCPDCGEAIAVQVHDQRPDDDTLLFHLLVPARRWWDDIIFT